jgi:hypothetical protein
VGKGTGSYAAAKVGLSMTEDSKKLEREFNEGLKDLKQLIDCTFAKVNDKLDGTGQAVRHIHASLDKL